MMKFFLAMFISVVSFAGTLIAQSYSFDVIADTAKGFWTFEAPSINNAGSVAFKGYSSSGEQVINLWSDGTLTRIHGTNSVNPSCHEFGRFSLNNDGFVAFKCGLRYAGTTSREGIYVGNGSSVARIVDSIPPNPSRTFFGLSINDSEQVAFQASDGMYIGNASSYFAIDSTGIFTTYTSGPVIDNNQNVTYYKTIPLRHGLFKRDASGYISPVTITNLSTTPYPNSDNRISNYYEFDANDSGNILLYAQATLPGEYTINRLFQGQVAPFTALTFSTIYASSPSVNNSETIAFLGAYDFVWVPDESEEGGHTEYSVGIFTSNNGGAANLIIGTSHNIAGSTVDRVSISREAFNDNGQLAFRTTLKDGREIIVRAIPQF